jgi:hypothetical protein
MVLRQILLHAPAYVMLEPQMLIPYACEKFDVETGDLTDEQTRERMRRSVHSTRLSVDRAAHRTGARPEQESGVTHSDTEKS